MGAKKMSTTAIVTPKPEIHRTDRKRVFGSRVTVRVGLIGLTAVPLMGFTIGFSSNAQTEI